MKNVRITEIYDDEGNLSRLEASDVDGGAHVLDGHWDPLDKQTSDNRASFRAWFNKMLRRKGYESIN